MGLIQVTSVLRNGKPFAKDIIIDLDAIAVPVVENMGGQSIVSLSETSDLNFNPATNKVQYVIAEDLATFVSLAPSEMFVGTVVARDSRPPSFPTAAFIIANVLGKLEENPLGSTFLYNEAGATLPTEYIVSEGIPVITGLTKSPTGTTIINDNIWTAIGQMVYATGVGTGGVITPGDNTNVLTLVAGVPVWAAAAGLPGWGIPTGPDFDFVPLTHLLSSVGSPIGQVTPAVPPTNVAINSDFTSVVGWTFQGLTQNISFFGTNMQLLLNGPNFLNPADPPTIVYLEQDVSAGINVTGPATISANINFTVTVGDSSPELLKISVSINGFVTLLASEPTGTIGIKNYATPSVAPGDTVLMMFGDAVTPQQPPTGPSGGPILSTTIDDAQFLIGAVAPGVAPTRIDTLYTDGVDIASSFKLISSAMSGYVLTCCDSFGNGIWAPPAGAISGLTQNYIPMANGAGTNIVDSTWTVDGHALVGTLLNGNSNPVSLRSNGSEMYLSFDNEQFSALDGGLYTAGNYTGIYVTGYSAFLDLEPTQLTGSRDTSLAADGSYVSLSYRDLKHSSGRASGADGGISGSKHTGVIRDNRLIANAVASIDSVSFGNELTFVSGTIYIEAKVVASIPGGGGNTFHGKIRAIYSVTNVGVLRTIVLKGAVLLEDVVNEFGGAQTLDLVVINNGTATAGIELQMPANPNMHTMYDLEYVAFT